LEVAKRAETVVFYKAGMLVRCQLEVTNMNALSSDVSEQELLGLTAISELSLVPAAVRKTKNLGIIGSNCETF
jgi:cation transport ATPase